MAPIEILEQAFQSFPVPVYFEDYDNFFAVKTCGIDEEKKQGCYIIDKMGDFSKNVENGHIRMMEEVVKYSWNLWDESQIQAAKKKGKGGRKC